MFINKRQKGASILIFLFCCFTIFLTFDTAASQTPNIAVIKSRDIPPYAVALEGFNLALQEKEIKAGLIHYNLETKERQSITAEILAQRPQLVLTLGSEATQLALEEIKDIPIVFSMVLNPVASGFVNSLDSSGNNLSGASLDISLAQQLQSLKEIVPRARRIGVLYDPQQTGDIIKEAARVAQEMKMELIPQAVSSEGEVPRALEELGIRTDCLWAVADSTVFSPQSAQFIILYTLRHRLPFMGISPPYVKAGALFALSCDYKDIGKQSGEIAVRILLGKTPSEIPITMPRKTYLSINLRTSSQIGLGIPADVISKAQEVIR